MTNFVTWEWMRAYLFTGLVVLYLLRMLNIWLNRTRRATHWGKELIRTFTPKKTLDWGDELLALLLLSLIAVVWPVALVWILISLRSRKASWRPQLPEDAFTCQSPHLRQTVTRAEAESVGTVIDPLGRAPALPFGHLNVGWLAFLGKEAEGFALCYFEVPPLPAAGNENQNPSCCQYRGFAWVKARKVKAEFVFEGS